MKNRVILLTLLCLPAFVALALAQPPGFGASNLPEGAAAHRDLACGAQAVVDGFGRTDFLQLDAHRLVSRPRHDPADSHVTFPLNPDLRS